MRKLPSELDVEILQAILAEELDASFGKGGAEGGGIEPPTASLTSDPLLALANGDFSISDTTTDSFAWDTRGASGIEDGQAVLTEDSPFSSNFTQTFTVLEEAKTIQFKLVEVDLGNTPSASPASPALPTSSDAFEDANTNESITGDTEINEGDSASFNAIASDPGDDTITYIWDFGDGSEQLAVSAEGLPVEHNLY